MARAVLETGVYRTRDPSVRFAVAAHAERPAAGGGGGGVFDWPASAGGGTSTAAGAAAASLACHVWIYVVAVRDADVAGYRVP